MMQSTSLLVITLPFFYLSFSTIEIVSLHYTVSLAQCSNIPPGVTEMSRGIDITKLDIISLTPGSPDGILRSLFEFTCVEGKTWRNPFNRTLIYDIPDQVEVIDSIPGGVLDAITTIYYKYEDTKNSQAKSLGLDFMNGMFSVSGSNIRTQEIFTNSTKDTLNIQAFFSAIHVDFSPYWDLKLRRTILNYIQNFLPDNYTQDPTKYKEFIRLFGTHYFGSGKFGGLFKVTADFESSLKNTMSSHDIQVNAESTFFGILKVSGGYNGTIHEVSQEFKSKSQITYRYFGGNINLLSGGDWENWWNTVPSNPWLFSGDLATITDLIPLGLKKNSLTLAISIHLDKAYLLEMQRTLYSFIGRGNIGDEYARELLAEVNVLSGKEITNTTLVKILGKKVNDYIIPPEWFIEYTQLCFDWYPDGDPGQCGGPSRHLCAKVNSMTPYYRDDTDHRPGGCQMKWGIISPRSMKWFEETGICFKWSADGDSGQCGDHSGHGETCSPLGGSTPYYRDDTDKRPGGCQMHWMFKVPISSPGWALNSKLCYFSYADGDAGQCGGAGDYCVIANTWTPYYRDDTDKRPGGCQMSWGIKV